MDAFLTCSHLQLSTVDWVAPELSEWFIRLLEHLIHHLHSDFINAIVVEQAQVETPEKQKLDIVRYSSHLIIWDLLIVSQHKSPNELVMYYPRTWNVEVRTIFSLYTVSVRGQALLRLCSSMFLGWSIFYDPFPHPHSSAHLLIQFLML